MGIFARSTGMMEEPPSRKKEMGLTQEAFNQFLRRLNSDREDAGIEYEILRRTLIIFFEQRGGLSPDDLADETINRIARILSEGKKIENINSYTLAVARNVLRENWRSPQRGETTIEELPLNRTPSSNPEESRQQLELLKEKEAQLECLKKCLKDLSVLDYSLIQEYHLTEHLRKKELRKKLADQEGISLNALRIRVHHIRAALEVCLKNCLG
jgi:DNA-directed RNA polymerase specialized sigma24 family protein